MNTITVSQQERDLILAALRLWQNVRDGRIFLDISEDFDEIATNSGEHKELSLDGIDALCERINC